jgi:hypothetical protein
VDSEEDGAERRRTAVAAVGEVWGARAVVTSSQDAKAVLPKL